MSGVSNHVSGNCYINRCTFIDNQPLETETLEVSESILRIWNRESVWREIAVSHRCKDIFVHQFWIFLVKIVCVFEYRYVVSLCMDHMYGLRTLNILISEVSNRSCYLIWHNAFTWRFFCNFFVAICT